VFSCLAISTEPTKIGNKATVKAVLTTSGTRFDWETFDALYVSMVVTDKNQVAQNERRGNIKLAHVFKHMVNNINFSYYAATLTIGVTNINDNAPVFVVDTLEDKSIRENTPVNQLIGYVVATDPDNLNGITYTIE
jgi:hypothetical protein